MRKLLKANQPQLNLKKKKKETGEGGGEKRKQREERRPLTFHSLVAQERRGCVSQRRTLVKGKDP